MAYTKQTWNDRDEISDTRLNNIEDGLVEYSKKTDENTDLIDSSASSDAYRDTVDAMLNDWATKPTWKTNLFCVQGDPCVFLTNSGASSTVAMFGFYIKTSTTRYEYLLTGVGASYIYLGRIDNAELSSIRRIQIPTM